MYNETVANYSSMTEEKIQKHLIGLRNEILRDHGFKYSINVFVGLVKDDGSWNDFLPEFCNAVQSILDFSEVIASDLDFVINSIENKRISSSCINRIRNIWSTSLRNYLDLIYIVDADDFGYYLNRSKSKFSIEMIIKCCRIFLKDYLFFDKLAERLEICIDRNEDDLMSGNGVTFISGGININGDVNNSQIATANSVQSNTSNDNVPFDAILAELLSIKKEIRMNEEQLALLNKAISEAEKKENPGLLKKFLLQLADFAKDTASQILANAISKALGLM